ncbi:hypothetical protein ACFL36_01335 [Thermodesulfobacteriota bacterium]
MKSRVILTSILAILLILISIPIYAISEVTLFGPKICERKKGSPFTETDNFTISNPSGAGKLIIHNGGEKKSRVSNAEIIFNGVPVFGPEDFNKNIEYLETDIPLQIDNVISIKLMGKPGSYLTVRVTKEVAVNVTLDEANRVSTEITRDGGTITTTDSDGTIYSLEIPADAFLEQDEVTITMTPIRSVLGLPAGGSFVVGVRLQPNSLQFFKPAVLKIQPPFTPVPDNTFGIVYRGLNGDYYTYPLFSIEEPNSTVTFHITHFSDWIAWTSDFCPQISAPSFTQDIYKNALACMLMTVGVDPSIAYPILLDWFNDFVFPSLESAFDLVSLKQSVLKYVEWNVNVQIFSLFEQFDDPQRNSAKSAIQKILDKLLSEMDANCRQPNTICERETIFLDAVELYRIAQILVDSDVEITVPDLHVFCDNLIEELVQSVEVGYGSGNFKPGETIELIAVLKNPKDQQIYYYDGPISWSSSDDQIARVETTYINENNVNAATFVLLSEGKVDILAVAGCDKFDTFSITVENPVPSDVEIEPNPATIFINETLPLTVTVKDENGNDLGGCPSFITWTIPPGGVIAFDPANQIVTGVAKGTATITATCEAMSGHSTITVEEEVESVEIFPDPATIFVDYTLPLNVTVIDKNGNQIHECPLEWIIPPGDIIAFDPTSQIVAGVSEGETTITATCQGISDTADIDVKEPISGYNLSWSASIFGSGESAFEGPYASAYGAWSIIGYWSGSAAVDFDQNVQALNSSGLFRNSQSKNIISHPCERQLESTSVVTYVLNPANLAPLYSVVEGLGVGGSSIINDPFKSLINYGWTPLEALTTVENTSYGYSGCTAEFGDNYSITEGISQFPFESVEGYLVSDDPSGNYFSKSVQETKVPLGAAGPLTIRWQINLLKKD